MSRKVEIFCPRCSWHPRQADRWRCSAACGCVWNTFDTGGVCPDCGKAWEETQCLACGGWSPHAAWYHERGEVPARREEEEPAILPEK